MSGSILDIGLAAIFIPAALFLFVLRLGFLIPLWTMGRKKLGG